MHRTLGGFGKRGQTLQVPPRDLKKVLKEAKLNFEVFSTVLVQVEACLNSGPLTPLPEASDTHEVLTPGHLLLGKTLAVLSQESDDQEMEALQRIKIDMLFIDDYEGLSRKGRWLGRSFIRATSSH